MLPPDQKRPSLKAPDASPESGAMSAGAAVDGDAGHHGIAALSPAPSLATLMHAFRRCWRLAVPAALLAACVGAAIALIFVPPQYSSVVVFRIQSRPSQGSLEDEGNF